MQNTLETLRDGLLVFSVVLLVYILYKRLLKILGKNERSKRYPTIGEEMIWKDKRTTTVSITLEEDSNLSISVYNNVGQKMNELMQGFYKIGTHDFDIDLSSLPAGRYYLKLVTEHQEASRYFDLQ